MISIVFSLRCFTEVRRILSLLYLLPLLQMYPAGVCGLLSLLYFSFADVYLLGNSHIPERDRESLVLLELHSSLLLIRFCVMQKGFGRCYYLDSSISIIWSFCSIIAVQISKSSTSISVCCCRFHLFFAFCRCNCEGCQPEMIFAVHCWCTYCVQQQQLKKECAASVLWWGPLVVSKKAYTILF